MTWILLSLLIILCPLSFLLGKNYQNQERIRLLKKIAEKDKIIMSLTVKWREATVKYDYLIEKLTMKVNKNGKNKT